MLAAIDLAFGYHRTQVGSGVTLSITQGEVLCLLGPNGCGKTTLFKTLLGLLPAKGGTIELDGRDIASFSRTDFARRVGYVPQANTAYFPFSVIEIVLMGRASRVAMFAAPSRADREIAQAALEALGIARLERRLYTEISGGERQMVLIARALAQQPAVIVMDEPTASLDFGNHARVLERIRSLAAGGFAIVLSTHDPGQAFACADRVALMKAGRVIGLGKPAQTLTEEALRDLYSVDIAVAFLEAAGHNVCAPALAKQAQGPKP